MKIDLLSRTCAALFLVAILTAGLSEKADAQGVAGTVDPTFKGSVTDFVTAVAVQSDDKIILGGAFTKVDGQPHSSLVRLNADGSVDTAFQGTADNFAQSLAVQADGKIVLSGGFQQLDGTAVGPLARLNADGTLDTAFLANLVSSGAASSTANSLAIQADGKILVCGIVGFTDSNGTTHADLVRLNTDGTVDSAFAPILAGDVSDEAVRRPEYVSFDGVAVALQADGKILFAGGFDSVNGLSRPTLVRLNTDGSTDASFDPRQAIMQGPDTTGLTYVREMAAQPDGKIIVSGEYALTGDENYTSYLLRLNADGSVDTGFSATIDDLCYSILVQSDGKILIGGTFSTVDGVAENIVARLNTDGSLDTTFVPSIVPGAGDSSEVDSLALQSDGKIILGGFVTQFDGAEHDNFFRLYGATVTAPFFAGQAPLSDGVYYLSFASGEYFGYYTYLSDPRFLYHFDLGYEYWFDADDKAGGIYFYDFASGSYFYTSPIFPFPYLYDYSLGAVLYYFPDPNNAGHYNTNGVRYFYNFGTGQIISK